MTDWPEHDLNHVHPDDDNELFGADGEYDDGDQTEADDMDEAAKVRLAAALAEVDAQFGRPPSEQVTAFNDVHQALQATLNRIDAG
ncbi:MAG TPA: hypothetical protein VGF84_06805 [Micromonosporaceae bacterium]|jgi:hypothetical protein